MHPAELVPVVFLKPPAQLAHLSLPDITVTVLPDDL